MSALLGCIADDYTGGTDLAGALVRNGMRTIQTVCGVPDAAWLARLDAEAIVVALKSRTIDSAQAVKDSLASLEVLRSVGCEQYFFKYCSTFDSTAAGNIGPVAEALAARLDAKSVIFCPAFPQNGRTVFKGYLFAGDVLLNESGMQDHPLTPMTDANLVRVLSAQTSQRVGLVGYDVVQSGVQAVRDAFAEAQANQQNFLIVDAIDDADLRIIGEACEHSALLTGGSGVAIGLPDNFRRRGVLRDNAEAARLETSHGASAIISGSCSRATQAQVAKVPAARRFKVDAQSVLAGDDVAAEAIKFATPLLGDDPVLIYSTAAPDELAKVHAVTSALAVGEAVEETLSRIASALVERGVGRLVVAGGETSGAVVQALGVKALRIGADIAPGVPWTQGVDVQGKGFIHLALKSGNFGGEMFFQEAFAALRNQ